MFKLKEPEYYLQNKKIFNYLYNREWKKIAGPLYIGLCSYLFQEFYKEWVETHDTNPDVQDFADYYLTHTNPEQSNEIKRTDSKFYGRSVEELMRLAEHYRDQCNNYTIELEKYFDDIINHAIIETYHGQMREILLIQEYEKKGYTAKHTSGKWDKDLGVDFIIYKNGVIKDYIQCKPLSTFRGNNNISLIEDRKNFFHKEIDKKKECEKLNYPYYPTKFILYHVDHPNKWCSINGRRGFFLEELINNDGTTKVDYKTFKYI